MLLLDRVPSAPFLYLYTRFGIAAEYAIQHRSCVAEFQVQCAVK